MSQTDECDFMKKSQVIELAHQQTTKIQGKVDEINSVTAIGILVLFISKLTEMFIFRFIS